MCALTFAHTPIGVISRGSQVSPTGTSDTLIPREAGKPPQGNQVLLLSVFSSRLDLPPRDTKVVLSLSNRAYKSLLRYLTADNYVEKIKKRKDSGRRNPDKWTSEHLGITRRGREGYCWNRTESLHSRGAKIRSRWNVFSQPVFLWSQRFPSHCSFLSTKSRIYFVMTEIVY